MSNLSGSPEQQWLLGYFSCAESMLQIQICKQFSLRFAHRPLPRSQLIFAKVVVQSLIALEKVALEVAFDCSGKGV